MEKLRVRFEQKRGHYMVLEGERPWQQKDCDEFQLRMLRACEVPGLLKLEAAIMDGNVSFRYKLDGTRMLSALVKAEKWTMTEWLTVLCRLAEILEECRLYMLDEDRICLDEDRIFVGEGWHDLKLVYLPLLEERTRLSERLHLLLVRWMSYVKEPEGSLLQQLLQISSSPDFKPAALRSFARQYLLEQSLIGRGTEARVSLSRSMDEAAENRLSTITGNRNPMLTGDRNSITTENRNLLIKENHNPLTSSGESEIQQKNGGGSLASSGWRWFQPSRSDAQSLSSMLDAQQEHFSSSESQEDWLDDHEENNAGKSKVWLVCAAAGAAAVGWRWGYAENPGTSGLILSCGVTLLAAAGAMLIWYRWLRGERHCPETGGHDEEPLSKEPKLQRDASYVPERREEVKPATGAEANHERVQPVHTVMLHEMEDRTQQLTEERSDKPVTFASSLLWETAPGTPLIPLSADSFLIGRSREACAHVDGTNGVSRVHLELLRTADGWTAKDLGSRNGSKLNGVPMVAYATYPLQAEDCLELAGSRYRLKP